MLISGKWPAALIGVILLAGCTPPPMVSEDAASARSLAVGRPAPTFALQDQDDNTVTLDQLRGQWVVLYFYPNSDAPPCVCDATPFTQVLYDLRETGATVYGVSEDSVETHNIFIEKYGLSLDLLSDPSHDMMRRYGAWVHGQFGDDIYERPVRSMLIVDPEGVVRYHWPDIAPQGQVQRLRQKLTQLRSPPPPPAPAAPTNDKLTVLSSKADLDAALLGDRHVLVFFYKLGCPTCILLEPGIHQLADAYGSRAAFAKMMVMTPIFTVPVPEVKKEHDIAFFPTVILFENGQETNRWVLHFGLAEYRKALDEAVGGPDAQKTETDTGEPSTSPVEWTHRPH